MGDGEQHLQRPVRWVLARAGGPRGFVTSLTWALPDGRTAQWSSREARRRGRMALAPGPDDVPAAVAAEPGTAARLGRVNALAALCFVLGGSLFALGAWLAQTGTGSTGAADLSYLVGGVFFSLGGYASVLQAVNAPLLVDDTGALRADGWRWWRTHARNLGWLSAVVLFAGTLLFGVSLVAAFDLELTPRQANGWIWFPDMLGCVCFLALGPPGAGCEVGARPDRRARRTSSAGGSWRSTRSVRPVLPRRARRVHVRPATAQLGRRRLGELGDLRRRRLLRGGRVPPGVRAARPSPGAATPPLPA